MKKDTSRFLNLGCGHRYFEEWTNVDFYRTGPTVVPCNLINGLPFSASSFEVVYHSHVLEHFSREDAVHFVGECYRVMAPGGILRIVVPDLEQIAREYLNNLQRALDGELLAEHDYEWIVLELMDQMVRNKSGGQMGKYWRQVNVPNQDYVEKRMGHEFASFRKSIEINSDVLSDNSKPLTLRKRLIQFLTRNKSALQHLEIGRFRASGEVHLWMYDRYSLMRLLSSFNFRCIKQVDAFTSGIPDWQTYSWLDIENGKVRKPDSLFMECVK